MPIGRGASNPLEPSSHIRFFALIPTWLSAANRLETWSAGTAKDWYYFPVQARLLFKNYLPPRDLTKLEETAWGENTKTKERYLVIYSFTQGLLKKL